MGARTYVDDAGFSEHVKSIKENLQKPDVEAYNNLYTDVHMLNNAVPEDSAKQAFEQLPKDKNGKVHGSCADIELKKDDKGNSFMEVTPLFKSK